MGGPDLTACLLRRNGPGHRGMCMNKDTKYGELRLCPSCQKTHPYVLMQQHLKMEYQSDKQFYQDGIEAIHGNWYPKTDLTGNGEYACASRQTRFRDTKGAKAKELVPKLTAARKLEVITDNEANFKGHPDKHRDENYLLCSPTANPDTICGQCEAVIDRFSDKEGTAGLKGFFKDGKNTLTDEVIKQADEQAT